MATDTYAYEEEQERVALAKALHGPIKKFYLAAGLEATYGQFPLFWQDFAAWGSFKEVNRLYLRATEGGGAPEPAQAEAATPTTAHEPQAGALEKDATEPAANGQAAAADTTEAADTTATGQPAEASVATEPEAPPPDVPVVASGVAPGADAEVQGTAAAADGVASAAAATSKRKARWGEARKSRWGSKSEEEESKTAESALSETARKRKARWSAEPTLAVPDPLDTTRGLSEDQRQEMFVLQLQLKEVNEKLATVVEDAAAREAAPDRTPSPPPTYGADGKRSNTRDVRMRDALNKERTRIIEKLLVLNPSYRPPVDYVRQKPERRLPIPLDEYPGYNFIGLIIGPRGNTQKRLERETGCRIAIRGRGSVKEGSRLAIARRGDEDEPLHVHVQGETEAIVEAGAKVIAELLVPMEDDNPHKIKQLRELALINGTLRDDDYCHICGDKGHRQYECPKRVNMRQSTVEVRCAICGDSSHPTRDCTQRGQQAPASNQVLDQEYLSFMAELGEAPPPGAAAAAAAAAALQPGQQPQQQQQQQHGAAGGGPGRGAGAGAAFPPLPGGAGRGNAPRPYPGGGGGYARPPPPRHQAYGLGYAPQQPHAQAPHPGVGGYGVPHYTYGAAGGMQPPLPPGQPPLPPAEGPQPPLPPEGGGQPAAAGPRPPGARYAPPPPPPPPAQMYGGGYYMPPPHYAYGAYQQQHMYAYGGQPYMQPPPPPPPPLPQQQPPLPP